ncbi:MAG: hypothetical protein K0R98_1514 [Rickettsiaceae bacterium]|jgi:opacity protein-like surface antigen|nr:hypothetical protein [Rickettsiaceae bacterium]
MKKLLTLGMALLVPISVNAADPSDKRQKSGTRYEKNKGVGHDKSRDDTRYRNTTHTSDAYKSYFSINGEYLTQSILSNRSDLVSNSQGAHYKHKNGYGIGLALGHNVSDNFRTEIEGKYRTDHFKLRGVYAKDRIDTITASFNGYYDFNNTTVLAPYIGAGIGATTDDDVRNVAFSYQLMAGVNYKLNDDDKISFGYRYFDVPDYHYHTHALEVAYRHSF